MLRHLWLYTSSLEEICNVAWATDIHVKMMEGITKGRIRLQNWDQGVKDDNSGYMKGYATLIPVSISISNVSSVVSTFRYCYSWPILVMF